MNLIYDPVIPLVGIYPKKPKILIWKNICTLSSLLHYLFIYLFFMFCSFIHPLSIPSEIYLFIYLFIFIYFYSVTIVIVALFIIAKLWKQPKCLLIDEWTKTFWYIHTMEYYLDIKRRKSYHLWQHGWTKGYYAQWNKSDRERQIPYYFTSMWNLKNKINEQTKLKQTYRHKLQTGGFQRRGALRDWVKEVKWIRNTNW